MGLLSGDNLSDYKEIELFIPENGLAISEVIRLREINKLCSEQNRLFPAYILETMIHNFQLYNYKKIKLHSITYVLRKIVFSLHANLKP